MPTIPVYIGPQARFLDRLRQQIHRSADQFGQTPLQRSQSKQSDARFRVQLNQKIDVAIDLGVATGDGTKQRHVTDAGAAQRRAPASQAAGEGNALTAAGAALYACIN